MQRIGDGWWLAVVLLALPLGACTEEDPADDDTSGEDDDSTPADDDAADDDAADDDATPADDDASDDDTTQPDDDTIPADDDTGPAPDDDAAAALRSFHLNLAEATVTEPPGVGALLTTYLVDYHLLMMPSEFTADSVDLLFALGAVDGTSYVQDMDFPTVKVDDALWDDPRFAVEGGLDLSIDLGDGTMVTLAGASVDGYFVGAGTAVVDGTLEAEIDSRDFDFLLGGDEGAVCELLEALLVECQPCPADGEPYCLHLAAEDITGTLVPGVVLSPVS